MCSHHVLITMWRKNTSEIFILFAHGSDCVDRTEKVFNFIS